MVNGMLVRVNENDVLEGWSKGAFLDRLSRSFLMARNR